MYMFTAAISILVFRAASLTKVLTCERLSAFASITPLCCPWLFTCPPAIYASSWLAGCATSTAQYVCLLHYNIVITFNAPTRTHTDIHANCFHSFALFAFFFRIFVLFFVTSICFVFFFFFAATSAISHLLFTHSLLCHPCVCRPPAARLPIRLSQINLLINTIWHWAQQNVNIACSKWIKNAKQHTTQWR